MMLIFSNDDPNVVSKEDAALDELLDSDIGIELSIPEFLMTELNEGATLDELIEELKIDRDDMMEIVVAALYDLGDDEELARLMLELE